MSEMNYSNDTKDQREELRIFCYFKVLVVQCYLTLNMDWLEMYIAISRANNFKKFLRGMIAMLSKDRKQDHMKCIIKTKKVRKGVKDKIVTKTWAMNSSIK